MIQLTTIPNELWNHPTLALISNYLIYLKAQQRTKVLFDDKIITLKYDEVAIKPEEMSTRWKITQQDIQDNLLKLTELDYIEIKEKEGFSIIQLKGLPLPPINNQLSNAPGDGKIVPLTFSEFREKYLEYIKRKRRPKTFENAERVMKHFEDFYGNKPLNDLRTEHLEDFFDYRIKNNSKISNATLNMDGRTMRAALQCAVTWEHLSKNPFRKAELPPNDGKKTPSMTKEDFDKCILPVEDPMIKNLFKFYSLTGFRRGEAIFLLWENVDFKAHKIKLVNTPYYFIKNKKEPQTFPISTDIESLLRSIHAESEFVFANPNGEPYEPDFITKYWKQITRDVGLNPNIRLHSIRASFATWLAEESVPPLVIRELMRHRHFTTTENYITPSQTEMLEALKKLKL